MNKDYRHDFRKEFEKKEEKNLPNLFKTISSNNEKQTQTGAHPKMLINIILKVVYKYFYLENNY